MLKLDTRTLRVEPVATVGEGPGWISGHEADRHGDAAIAVTGGEILAQGERTRNRAVFVLDLARMAWQRRRARPGGPR